MSTELITESAVNESAGGIDEKRYAAAWEASILPPSSSASRWTALRRFAARPSARLSIAATLVAIVAGAAWIYRRRAAR